jgi:hypothetical protein
MEFSTVSDFLKKASSSKDEERELIANEVDPLIHDPSTVGIPHEMLDLLNSLKQKHGDETLKQVALFCLGSWLEMHKEILAQHLAHEAITEAMVTIADITTLVNSTQQIQATGSFGGDDSWRKMLKEIVSQDVLEEMEARGIDVKTALQGEER